MKFAESTPMTNDLGVNPENSRKIQQTMQILCQSHNTSVNHTKFVTFANDRQDKLHISYTFLTHFAHILLHVFHMYAHILHHCRLVLNTYKCYHVNRILR